MKKSNPTITQLNELLAINNDAEKIYLDALHHVENEDLKNFFRAMAFERSEFCRFLGAEIIQKGGNPEYPEDEKGALTKLWSRLKQIISKNDEYALFDEICRMKTWTIDKYNDTLNKIKFSEHIAQLLQKQRDAIERSLHAIQIGDRQIA